MQLTSTEIDIEEIACENEGFVLYDYDLAEIYNHYMDMDFALGALAEHLATLRIECEGKARLIEAIDAIIKLMPVAPELNYQIKDMHESNVAKHERIKQNYLKLIKPTKRARKTMKSDYKTYLQRTICQEFATDDEAKQWLHNELGYNINSASESQLETALNKLTDCPTI